MVERRHDMWNVETERKRKPIGNIVNRLTKCELNWCGRWIDKMFKIGNRFSPCTHSECRAIFESENAPNHLSAFRVLRLYVFTHEHFFWTVENGPPALAAVCLSLCVCVCGVLEMLATDYSYRTINETKNELTQKHCESGRVSLSSSPHCGSSGI